MLTPTYTGTPSYAVQASSAISSVTHFVLNDNRLVVDIHNALSALEGDFDLPPTLPIAKIGHSQFSRSPHITRLVFHLTEAVDFSLSLSADRRLLTISFSQNEVTELLVGSDGGADTVTIRAVQMPAVQYEVDNANRRLRIHITNAVMPAPFERLEGGAFVSRVVTGNNEDGTAFADIYFHNGSDMPGVTFLNTSGNQAVLMLYGRVEGVTYLPAKRALRLCRSDGLEIDISQIRHFDEYLRGLYTMVLPAGVEPGTMGLVHVGDGNIKSFLLARDVNGNVQIIFETEKVLAFVIEETPEAYYILARDPREVYSMVIVIDPGHGSNDPGVMRNGIRESEYVLAFSFILAERINRHPHIRAYLTRHGDTNPGIFWRAEFANSFADIMISVHLNGFTNTAVHGIETHYTISPGEVGNAFNSLHLANIVQNQKIAQTNTHSRGLFHSPQFPVIREAKNIPAVLSELGFISNTAEAAKLATPEYKEKLVQALYNAVLETQAIIGR
jgi:N-acetylmuramoyl-L-alanine amidase